MASTPYLYQYGIGGALLAVGLFYGWKAGFVGLEPGSKRRNLLIILGGLLFYMAFQAFLQFSAPDHSYQAPKPAPIPDPTEATTTTRGTGLDYGIMIGYFLAILAIGSYFGRHSKSTKDFFFGGQKFSWWFITMSLIATTIGSYSFVKYSRVAYSYGISSSQTYLNDWFWLPLFLFGWLPIIFFSRVVSIPEYFERRFGPGARATVTFLLLIYLIGYIGINLFTMGKALHFLLGWDIFTAAILVATISAIYVTAGGQTSVIVTDLFQGFMLLLTGAAIIFLGITALGGFSDFWANLVPEHRMAFTNFNTDPEYSSVGIFWQDAMANSAVFFFLNQGVMMRFLSTKSVNEGKKAALASMLILMPVAAVVVASGGWVGSAMNNAGMIPEGTRADSIFFVVSDILCSPGVFGLVMAALTAALMSTVDTLITAVSAIVVNDIWKPYVKKDEPDRYYLKIARYTAVGVTLLGVLLVPLFMSFGSIYSAHAAFTAAVTPPLVIALLLAMLWPRYTPAAATATVLGGFVLIILSVFNPSWVKPFSHGIPTEKVITAQVRVITDPGALEGIQLKEGEIALSQTTRKFLSANTAQELNLQVPGADGSESATPVIVSDQILTKSGGLAIALPATIQSPILGTKARLRLQRTKTLSGAKAYKFTRALFGLAVSLFIGIMVSLFTRPRPAAEIEGLTQATSRALVRKRYGKNIDPYRKPMKIQARVVIGQQDEYDEKTGALLLRLSPEALASLQVAPGDEILLADRRWWFGGLKSIYSVVSATPLEGSGATVEIGPGVQTVVAAKSEIVVLEALI